MDQTTEAEGSHSSQRRRKWRLPPTFAALQHRNYRLFFGGQLISLTGTWMQQMAQAWLVYQLTNSAFLLGLIGSIGSLPVFLLAVPGGVIADRKDKRHILLATQSCLMVLALVLAGLTATGWVRTWHVAVVAAMTGLVMAFDMPARQAFVVEMVGRSELMNAIALNSSIFNSARIFGPAIAGVVVAGVGMAWCFFINGLSFLAVLVGLLLMRFPPRKREAKETGVLAGALDGVHFLRRHPRVSGLVTLLGVFSIFGWSYSLLMPIFARDILHSGPKGLGMLMTANGTGALVGALLVASLTYYPGRARILFAGGFLFSVAISGFAFSRLFLLSAFLLALAGLGGVSLMSTANTMIQISVPDELRGRIMGVWALVFAGSAPVGSFQAGTVAHYLGAPRAVLIGATITAIATVSALLSRGRMRRQQTAAHIE